MRETTAMKAEKLSGVPQRRGARSDRQVIDDRAHESAEIDAINGGDTLVTVHQIASGLFRIGAFDKATMRRFDEACLTPVQKLNAGEIRTLRESSGVSQAVLAKIMNVTTSTIGQWERGEKSPSGSALKLLALMRAKGVGSVL